MIAFSSKCCNPYDISKTQANKFVAFEAKFYTQGYTHYCGVRTSTHDGLDDITFQMLLGESESAFVSRVNSELSKIPFIDILPPIPHAVYRDRYSNIIFEGPQDYDSARRIMDIMPELNMTIFYDHSYFEKVYIPFKTMSGWELSTKYTSYFSGVLIRKTCNDSQLIE